MSTAQINQRKRDHLDAIAHDADIERQKSSFDKLALIHRALPEINYNDIDTRCRFLGKTLSFPLLISSMTGGDDAKIRQINRNLAIAAETCQVAMAVGSQRVMMNDRAAEKSFSLRHLAPTTLLLGNIGAIQLNKGFTLEHCQRAIDVVRADGLYLHLNPLQEAIQPEGETDFAQLTNNIAAIAKKLNTPLILKEVGCGLSPADIGLGRQAGIDIFDVAGRGGTSWSRIEYHRRQHPDDDLGLVFQDWGMTTVQSLQLASHHHPEVTLIASGGIRTGIDMVKAVILGAELCGIAAPLLKAALISEQAVINTIRQLQRQYQTAMFLLGYQHHRSLKGQTQLFLNDTNDANHLVL